VLKKAGIAVAVATAGVLALAPFALAEDQTNTQTSDQGEGELNGHNYLSGLDEQLICNENLDGSLHHPEETLIQGGGDCTHSSTVEDQVEKQHQWEH
jgi:hypothetical protein